MSALAKCHLRGQEMTCALLWLAVDSSCGTQPCFFLSPNSQSARDNISRGQGWCAGVSGSLFKEHEEVNFFSGGVPLLPAHDRLGFLGGRCRIVGWECLFSVIFFV